MPRLCKLRSVLPLVTLAACATEGVAGPSGPLERTVPSQSLGKGDGASAAWSAESYDATQIGYSAARDGASVGEIYITTTGTQSFSVFVWLADGSTSEFTVDGTTVTGEPSTQATELLRAFTEDMLAAMVDPVDRGGPPAAPVVADMGASDMGMAMDTDLIPGDAPVEEEKADRSVTRADWCFNAKVGAAKTCGPLIVCGLAAAFGWLAGIALPALLVGACYALSAANAVDCVGDIALTFRYCDSGFVPPPSS